VIRCKYKRYIDVVKKVQRIQVCYKYLLKRKIKAAIRLQAYYRGYLHRKKLKGDFDVETKSDKAENSKLADELFEVGNMERERRKEKRLNSLSKLDILTSEVKPGKEPEIPDEQVLEELMNEDNKLFDNTPLIPKKKVKKRVKGEKKIEDKLIELGENLRKRKNELKLQKIKEEEDELIFKPKTNLSSNKNGLKFNQTEFLKRMYYFKDKKEGRMEEMRNKKADNYIYDYPFKPKLSEIAKRVGKRTVDDLYNWKNKKEENLTRKIKERQMDEDRKIDEECGKKYRMNASSVYFLQQRMERSKLEKEENNFEDADLWPVDLKKNYFEKKKDKDN